MLVSLIRKMKLDLWRHCDIFRQLPLFESWCLHFSSITWKFQLLCHRRTIRIIGTRTAWHDQPPYVTFGIVMGTLCSINSELGCTVQAVGLFHYNRR
ncbi:hypothetical protein HOLleu_42486 [Holothuria leucospilota]|uniref:Uncharacterized protein n=1 Tax=Holothuria leucospilota TaxID=206669 RepID=A0A9Q1B9B1_HOLLE|nr:hypothetical protein HOLleu_42486 [Holothuria leucospilota]